MWLYLLRVWKILLLIKLFNEQVPSTGIHLVEYVKHMKYSSIFHIQLTLLKMYLRAINSYFKGFPVLPVIQTSGFSYFLVDSFESSFEA